ncbi:thioesterase [Streptomyces mashuensis]|uniref:Thioesterase n=1 Tax=Streptomyces mashuensis TaxID=33904 RepID=A0A919B0A8_9ACTN|nr:thioesterase family protein [Streptomyces mashuensis]GHF35955.1 thioesterase [Streptomyces mashuensis]
MARHTYTCPLRWSDMDAYGHVNNVVYLRYLEEARIDFVTRLAREGGGHGPFSAGSVVARHEIDYLRPLVHRPEPVTVETWVTRIGGGSVTVSCEVKDEEHVYARARTVVVPFDVTAGRSRRITDEEREILTGWTDEDTQDEKKQADEGAVAA